MAPIQIQQIGIVWRGSVSKPDRYGVHGEGYVQTSLLVTRPSTETLWPEVHRPASRGRFADAEGYNGDENTSSENDTGVYVTFASSITPLTVEATAIRPSQCLRLQDALDTPYGLSPEAQCV